MQANADVNKPTFSGDTALHLAVSRRNVGMAALLVSCGADPEAENYEPLHQGGLADETDAECGHVKCSQDGETELGHTPADLATGDKKVGFLTYSGM